MPLHRRVPKLGFTSRRARYVAELGLHELNKLSGTLVTLAALKEIDLVGEHIKSVRVILKGEIKVALQIKDKAIHLTKGARAAIESASGTIETI